MENTTTAMDRNSTHTAQSLPQACENYVSPPKCTLFYFTSMGVAGALICVVGICCNIFSFLVMKSMNQNPQTAFLLKCLAVFDSMYLFSYLINRSFSIFCEYFDFRMIFYTRYLYFHVCVASVLYRMSGGISYWITCIITTNR